MKNYIAILALAVLASCGTPSTETSTATDSTAVVTAVVDSTVAVADTSCNCDSVKTK